VRSPTVTRSSASRLTEAILREKTTSLLS